MKKMTIRSPFTRLELERTIDDMVLQLLIGLTGALGDRKFGGMCVGDIHKIKDVDTETSPEFQEKFYVLMDVLAPAYKYAYRFIKRDHPDALYLFNCLWKLYNKV